MNKDCTIQLFAGGRWHDAASTLLFGAEEQGCLARTYTGYATEWAFEHGGAPDWGRVLDTVCAQCSLPRAPLVAGLKALAPRLRKIATDSGAFGLEAEVSTFVGPAITAQVQALRTLK